MRQSRDRQAIRSANREAAISAGRDLFYLNGYGGTSLALIAQHAGVSTATLFKHFPTKAEVLRAVIIREWIEVELDFPAEGSGGERDVLRGIGRVLIEFARKPGTADLFRLIVAEVRHLPELEDLEDQLIAGPFLRATHRWFASAGLPSANIDLAAQQYVGLIAGQVLWPTLMNPNFVQPADHDEEIIETALHLVLKETFS